MKPSWSDAPEWANWLAKDESGEWYWYENEPTRLVPVFGGEGNIIGYELNPDSKWGAKGRYQLVEDDIYWQSTLEQRPREVEND